MKKFLIIFFLMFPMSLFSQSFDDTYIQLSSIYFLKTGSSTIPMGYKLLIYEQGRYFYKINTTAKILLKAYSSNQEYKKFGDQLLIQRVNKIKNILVQDCFVDSTRFVIDLVGNKVQTNKKSIANQRVDIEITR